MKKEKIGQQIEMLKQEISRKNQRIARLEQEVAALKDVECDRFSYTLEPNGKVRTLIVDGSTWVSISTANGMVGSALYAAARDRDEPLLGLATTEELFREIIARFTVTCPNVAHANTLSEMLGSLSAEDREYWVSSRERHAWMVDHLHKKLEAGNDEKIFSQSGE